MKSANIKNELSPLGISLSHDQLDQLNRSMCPGIGWVFNIAGIWPEIKEVRHGVITMQLLYRGKRTNYERAEGMIAELIHCKAFDFLYRVYHVMVAEYYIPDYTMSPLPVNRQREREEWNRRHPDCAVPCFGDNKIFMKRRIYDQQYLVDGCRRNPAFN